MAARQGTPASGERRRSKVESRKLRIRTFDARLQHELQEREIQPGVELAADGPEDAGRLEAEAAVEGDARLLLGGDAGDDGVHIRGPRPGDEVAKERAADAAAMEVGANIDRVLDGETVGGAGAE